MQINYFKVLGLVGLLASELTKAAEDGKITVDEAITIIGKLCAVLGLELDQGVNVGDNG